MGVRRSGDAGGPRGAAGALGELAGGNGLLSVGGQAPPDGSGVGESGAGHRWPALPLGPGAAEPAHAVFGSKEGAETVAPRQSRQAASASLWAWCHDLAGNLYEWVTDWYDDAFYTLQPTINPHGPPDGTAKVQRGGSYINQPYRLRTTFRTKGDPTEHDPNVGFRCAQDGPAPYGVSDDWAAGRRERDRPGRRGPRPGSARPRRARVVAAPTHRQRRRWRRCARG